MHTVLITGSAGFIGKHVANIFIKKNFKVYGLDKKRKLENCYFRCDIMSKKKLYIYIKNIKPQIVIHLAARTDLLGKKISDYKANYIGTKNLINICNNTKSVERVIFAYTLLVNRLPWKSNSYIDYDADTLYGQSKVLMEKIIRSEKNNFTWCIIRPTTIWGDSLQNHFKLFYKLIKNKLYFHSGSKKVYKSYGYVKNASFQIFKLATCKPNLINKKTFYISDYTPICLNDFADKISLILNNKKNRSIPIFIVKFISYFGDLINYFGFCKFPLQSMRLKNMTTNLVINQTKLKKICGKLPYNEQESLHNFIESYK